MQLRPNSLPQRLELLAYVEEERRRLARDLHDDISQRLAMMVDDLSSVRDHVTAPRPACEKLDGLVQQARSLADDLRNISHTLHPAVLEDLGLEVALRSLVRHFGERSGLAAKFHAAEVPPKVPIQLATTIYRITQEALRNVAKHAGDAPVSVDLRGGPSRLELVVADEGDGFAPDSPVGLGLTSMRERAQLAGGELEITSQAGEGATIRVYVPLPGPLLRNEPLLDGIANQLG